MLNLRSFPFTAAALVLAATASAQAGVFYTFTQSGGAYTPVTAGTAVATSSATNTLDDAVFSVPLPFAFPYLSAPQTQIWVSTNGWIAFGATSPGATNWVPLSATVAAPGFVAACGRDLQAGFVFAGDRTVGSTTLANVSAIGPMSVGDPITGTGIAAGTTITAIAGNTTTMSAAATSTGAVGVVTAFGPWSDIRTDLVGTAPNQEFVVQWSNFRRFSTTLTTNNGTVLNFQIRLRQDGQIQCVYGDCNPGLATVNTTVLHQVGLRGPTNAFPFDVNARFNTKGVNDDWSQSSPATANTQGLLFNSVTPANVIPNGLTYTWTPQAGTIANNTTVGAGCGSAFASFYQLFASGTMNLGGTALTQFGSPATVVPTVGTLLPVSPTATVLALTDDSQVVYTYANGFAAPGWGTSVTVCSNGFVSKASGNGTGTLPTAATFLAGSQDWYAVGWHDLNPAATGSGKVKVEETASLLTITWDGVYDFLGTSPASANTMQMQVTSAGDVTYAYGAISTGGNGWLVGYSPAGPNLDPGSRVLLNAAPFTLSTPELAALALTATNRPLQGASASNWNLTVTNIPASTVLGADLFGLADANLLDLSLFGLGRAGCQLRATPDILNIWFNTGATRTYSFTIPPTPTLNGVALYTQAVVLGNATLADSITSNGIAGIIGNL
ncbi:MAG: hypothetical protein ACK6D2_03455 [Planctomycetota bacterium]